MFPNFENILQKLKSLQDIPIFNPSGLLNYIPGALQVFQAPLQTMLGERKKKVDQIPDLWTQHRTAVLYHIHIIVSFLL